MNDMSNPDVAIIFTALGLILGFLLSVWLRPTVVTTKE